MWSGSGGMVCHMWRWGKMVGPDFLSLGLGFGVIHMGLGQAHSVLLGRSSPGGPYHKPPRCFFPD